MKSIPAPYTKTARLKADTQVSTHGRSATAPAGTRCVFLGTHWVVHDLDWLAAQEGARQNAEMYQGKLTPRQEREYGRGSIIYHDADHYGFTVDAADLEDIADFPKR